LAGHLIAAVAQHVEFSFVGAIGQVQHRAKNVSCETMSKHAIGDLHRISAQETLATNDSNSCRDEQQIRFAW